MNKLILISALLVATLSAVYAGPYSSQERLLSLLENARQEQADEQDEVGAVARTAWWGRTKKDNEREGLIRKRNKLIKKICTYASLLYDICSGYVEKAPEEEPSAIVQGHCKTNCGLKEKIDAYKRINSALGMFVSDSQTSMCAYLETVQKLCGVPEPVEGDEDEGVSEPVEGDEDED